MKKARRIAILGFGLEGRALFSYLRKKGETKITICDQNTKIHIPRGAGSQLGAGYLQNLDSFDIIFRSPGILYVSPEIARVKKKVSSLTKLFLEEKRGKVIGVTGSAGKTTTATLLWKILKNAGKDAYLAGNIGINSLPMLDKLKHSSVTVLELSSFQLHDVTRSPEIAIILDIYEEHLDKHTNFKEYTFAKGNIGKFQKKSDTLIFNFDNIYSRLLAKSSMAKKISYSLVSKKTDIHIHQNAITHKKKGIIISLTDIQLIGKHNVKNIMAAIAAAIALGVPNKKIREAVHLFRGLDHRVQFVCKKGGVSFYDDSKATNAQEAIAGVESFTGSKIILSGGHSKNIDLMPLARRLLKPDIRCAVFFGDLRFDLEICFRKIGGSNYVLAKSLKDALDIAYAGAKPGDLILLEPGAASFDEFSGYKERGEKFSKWAKDLYEK